MCQPHPLLIYLLEIKWYIKSYGHIDKVKVENAEKKEEGYIHVDKNCCMKETDFLFYFVLGLHLVLST